jgi:hypothetical protein
LGVARFNPQALSHCFSIVYAAPSLGLFRKPTARQWVPENGESPATLELIIAKEFIPKFDRFFR